MNTAEVGWQVYPARWTESWVLGGVLTVAPVSERTEYELEILITFHKDDSLR